MAVNESSSRGRAVGPSVRKAVFCSDAKFANRERRLRRLVRGREVLEGARHPRARPDHTGYPNERARNFRKRKR